MAYMRIAKLGPSEFPTLESVERFFLQELPNRSPAGKFNVSAKVVNLDAGEQVVFTYDKRVRFTCFAEQGITLDSDPSSLFPHSFIIDLSTLRPADADVQSIQVLYNNSAGTQTDFFARTWNRLPKSVHTEGLWRLLRDTADWISPDELPTQQLSREGKMRQVAVTVYERSSEARSKCIDHYGASCSVCDFDFEKVFGEIGRGFIHVHHLKPLSSIGEEYLVDPIIDLRPVCPNCHAMLHMRNPLFAIDELRSIIMARTAAALSQPA